MYVYKTYLTFLVSEARALPEVDVSELAVTLKTLSKRYERKHRSQCLSQDWPERLFLK